MLRKLSRLGKRRAKMFSSLIQRWKKAPKKSGTDGVARLIEVSRFLGASTPREAAEMTVGRPLTEDEWSQIGSKWQRIWDGQESQRSDRTASIVTEPQLKAGAEGDWLHQLRLAISTITDEPIAGKDATVNAASAAALLTNAIVSKTISTIADDDDRFVAGIFAFVLSNYFALVLAGGFEEASTLAVIEVLGMEEFHRGFTTIQESYNQMVQSRPKILEAIGKACEAWFKNPDASQFERLVELFKILRTHVVQT
jgi:hypothetical protein